MQTLKIQIPNGFEIDSFDKHSGEVRLKEKPKAVTDRIKKIADVLSDNGLTEEDFDESCNGLDQDEVAYRLIKMIAKSLNEGWIPNWKDSSEAKYYAWFEMDSSSGFRFFDYAYWLSRSTVGSRLCFKTRALAEYAGQQFTDVYKRFMVI